MITEDSPNVELTGVVRCPYCEEDRLLSELSLEPHVLVDARTGRIEMEGQAYLGCPECGEEFKEADVFAWLDPDDDFDLRSPIPDDHTAEYEVIDDDIEVDSKETLLAPIVSDKLNAAIRAAITEAAKSGLDRDGILAVLDRNREATSKRAAEQGTPARDAKVSVWVITGKATVRRTVRDANGEDVPDLTEDEWFELTWECPETDFVEFGSLAEPA
jgi:hypothetical protein